MFRSVVFYSLDCFIKAGAQYVSHSVNLETGNTCYEIVILWEIFMKKNPHSFVRPVFERSFRVSLFSNSQKHLNIFGRSRRQPQAILYIVWPMKPANIYKGKQINKNRSKSLFLHKVTQIRVCTVCHSDYTFWTQYAMVRNHLVKILVRFQQICRVSEFLGI